MIAPTGTGNVPAPAPAPAATPAAVVSARMPVVLCWGRVALRSLLVSDAFGSSCSDERWALCVS